MTTYRVELNYMRKKDKPKKTDSLIKAREIAMNMMLDNNGRFVYGKIFIGDSTTPKYIIQTYGMYSKPLDAIEHGGWFIQATNTPKGWKDSKRLNWNGTVARY